jgi:CheY-like chemotaxis protein
MSSEGALGVLARLEECVSRPVKRLLLVEDDPRERQRVVELIGNGDVSTTSAATGAEAIAAVRGDRFDCVVVDLPLPDMDGAELIERLRAQGGLAQSPVIVYTAYEVARRDDGRLRRVAQSIIQKGARAGERLFDETALFLHRPVTQMPEAKRRMLEALHDPDAPLRGKKVLLVDDDIRNIYAMTSVLERHHVTVVSAETGREAIGILHGLPGIDAVLMDMMLPEIDGFETIRSVRQDGGFATLPIIAVTAKAMRGDREKCIEAGASDYLAKPVDSEQLLTLLRVWLSD